jgi:rRNA processing protein Krr1/Pno1
MTAFIISLVLLGVVRAEEEEDDAPIDVVTIVFGCFIGVLVWSIISYIGGGKKSTKPAKQKQQQKQQPKPKQQPKQQAKHQPKHKSKQQAKPLKQTVRSAYEAPAAYELPKKKPTTEVKSLGESVPDGKGGAPAAIGASHTIDPSEIEDGGWSDVKKKEKKKRNPASSSSLPQAPFEAGAPKAKIVFDTIQRLPSGKYQVNIQLNRESCMTVIGKGGMMIKNIRQKTNAEIQIDRENEVCEITGKDTQVKRAHQAVQSLVANQTKVTIELGEHVPAIIGKGGEVIKAIRARTGAQLDIDKLTNTCDLSGTKEQVAKAKMLIEEIIGHANALIADHTTDIIMVEPNDVVLIIGKGGLTIRGFQERSGARFDIDRNTCEITISGSSAQVVNAKEMIEQHLAFNSHSYVFLLGDDSNKKAAILGKKVRAQHAYSLTTIRSSSMSCRSLSIISLRC